MKKRRIDPEIVRLTNGTAKSTSWEKMESASGVIYVGSRGSGVDYGLSGPPPRPPEKLKVTPRDKSQPLQKKKISTKPAFGTIKEGKPENRFLR